MANVIAQKMVPATSMIGANMKRASIPVLGRTIVKAKDPQPSISHVWTEASLRFSLLDLSVSRAILLPSQLNSIVPSGAGVPAGGSSRRLRRPSTQLR